jgi:hypothetical protein
MLLQRNLGRRDLSAQDDDAHLCAMPHTCWLIRNALNFQNGTVRTAPQQVVHNQVCGGNNWKPIIAKLQLVELV